MVWVEIGLDISILLLLSVLLWELRKQKHANFRETLERVLVEKEAPDGPQSRPMPGAQGGLGLQPGNDQEEHESAYERVVELLREGFSVERIVKEITQIPEQEVRLIAKLKRPRRSM